MGMLSTCGNVALPNRNGVDLEAKARSDYKSRFKIEVIDPRYEDQGRYYKSDRSKLDWDKFMKEFKSIETRITNLKKDYKYTEEISDDDMILFREYKWADDLRRNFTKQNKLGDRVNELSGKMLNDDGNLKRTVSKTTTQTMTDRSTGATRTINVTQNVKVDKNDANKYRDELVRKGDEAARGIGSDMARERDANRIAANKVAEASDKRFKSDDPWVVGVPGNKITERLRSSVHKFAPGIASSKEEKTAKQHILKARELLKRSGVFEGDPKFKANGKIDEYTMKKIIGMVHAKDDYGVKSVLSDPIELKYIQQVMANMKPGYTWEYTSDMEAFDEGNFFKECESLLGTLDSNTVCEESTIVDLNELINQL